MHEIFLQERGVYLVVFDLAEVCKEMEKEHPHKKKKEKKGKNGGGKKEEKRRKKRKKKKKQKKNKKKMGKLEKKTKKKSLERILYWLCSIHHAAPIAPILLVGTHFDKLDKKEQKEQLDKCEKYLLPIFDKPFWKQIVKDKERCFFAVDRTQNTVDPLRQKIVDVVGKIKKTRIPLFWTKIIADLYEENKEEDYIKLKEVQKIFRRHSKEKVSSLDGVLDFYSNVGRLVFHKEQDLRRIVILNPSWLFNKMVSILYPIKKKGRHSNALKETVGSIAWDNDENKLLEQGFLTKNYMDARWKKDGDGPDCRRMLEGLLLKHNLIIPTQKLISPEQTDRYLVPSLLPDYCVDLPSDVDFSRSPKEWCEPCLFQFWEEDKEKGKEEEDKVLSFYIPANLYTRLVGKLVVICKDAWLAKKNGVFSCYGERFALAYDLESGTIGVNDFIIFSYPLDYLSACLGCCFWLCV